MGRSAQLFPLPTSLLRILGFIIRKQNEMDRLLGFLQVDSDYTRKTLNWSPSVSIREGIRRMVQGI